MGQASTLTAVAAPEAAPVDAPPRRRFDWRRWTPPLVVAAIVAFDLVVLRAAVWSVEIPDDTAFHAAMARWAARRIEHGHLPFDGWFPLLSLGAPEFHLYQSLPHILTGLVGSLVGVDGLVRWILYLGLATWPIAIYWSARLFGFDRWQAAGAALVSPLLNSLPGMGFEWHSYSWIGWGLWTQLWGMWLLPFALAMSWRAVSRGRGYAVAALLIALTISVHFLNGYVALVALGLWVVITPREFLVRLARAAAIGVGAVLASAWVIVPLQPDVKWVPSSEDVRSRLLSDSWGAPKVLRWFVQGDLFDWHRLPVVTMLLVVGLGVCALRFTRSERHRAVSLFFVLGLAMFFGRATWGSALRVLPFSDDLLFHRFLSAAQLGGIWLAGVGAAWLARAGWHAIARARDGEGPPVVQRLARSPVVVAAAIALVIVIVVAPMVRERASYASRNNGWVERQRVDEPDDLRDVLALARIAEERGDGRVYAGAQVGWGTLYRVGAIPVRTVLENHDIDTLGTPHTNSLMLDAELRFDESNPAQYDLFNVRYLLLPEHLTPVVPATEIAARGRHRLWEVPTSGYLQVVDTVGPPVVEQGSDVGRKSQAFLDSDQLTRGQYPTVAYDGDDASAPSATGTEVGTPGRVVRQHAAPQNGRFAGTVEVDRPAVVLLKATYHPRWRATVDGLSVPVQMVAPALVGVPVGPGTHRVELHYEPISTISYVWLFGVGVLALVLLAVIPRRVAQRRRIRR